MSVLVVMVKSCRSAQSYLNHSRVIRKSPRASRGIHIILSGIKPDAARCTAKNVFGIKQIEIYSSGRYFSFTGERYGDVAEVNDCSPQLANLCAKLWPVTSGGICEPVGVSSPSSALTPKERYFRYLDAMPMAISGQGGHPTTFQAACDGFRFALSDENVWEGLLWYNENKCQPPWNHKDLRYKLESAKTKINSNGEYGKHLEQQSPTYRPRPIARPSADGGDGKEHWTMFPLTVAGNGERFARLHGGGVKCAGGEFYIFDGALASRC